MNHNKKRNTAFLFEILLQEQTKCVLKKQDKKAKFIESILKKYFDKNSLLYKDLELYNALLECRELANDEIDNIISLAREEKRNLAEDKLFVEQSKLISLINKSLGNQIFENFVPNYKILATINLLLSKNTSISEKLLMEKSYKEFLKNKDNDSKEFIKEDVNMIIFKKCLENFNAEYSELLSEQKKLLNQYLLYKFGEEIDFKLYINEESKRLINNIENGKNNIQDNVDLVEKVDKALKALKMSANKNLDDIFIYSMLNYQRLSRELENAK